MPSKNDKIANQYIAELQSQLVAYRRFTKEKIQPWFRKNDRERKPPEEFVDSSFLYIRSYDSDIGVRPFPTNIVYWHSPDVKVAPITDLSAYTTLLDSGKTYQFSCTVRNRGDLIVPSAKVEFFLCDPTLGFSTQFATQIGITTGWVNPYATNTVSIVYTIPPSISGHKCLFARAFSFSPVDLPTDVNALHPPTDRHVAQLNLNITAQTSAFNFNWVHLPNAQERIDLVPMTTEEMFALRHPFLADFKPSRISAGEFIPKMQVTLLKKEDSASQVKIQRRGSALYVTSQNKKGISLEEQKTIWNNLARALKAIAGEGGSARKYREIFKAFRNMNRQLEQSRFELQLPDLGLPKGEATAVKIVATNRVTGEVKGGITLIITG
jgi:hypothetical protein